MSGKSKQSINQQLADLAELVAWFESEQFILDEAFKKFEEAERIATEIDEQLNVFKNKIDIIKKDFSKSA